MTAKPPVVKPEAIDEQFVARRATVADLLGSVFIDSAGTESRARTNGNIIVRSRARIPKLLITANTKKNTRTKASARAM